MLLIEVVTSYVTQFISLLFKSLPHKKIYPDMSDVTTYVTPIVGSLTERRDNGFWQFYQAFSVDTRTHHRVPSTPGVMHRSSRRRRSDRQRDMQDSRRTLLKTRNPTHPGGTLSGSAAAMGCPRSIRSPLEPRDSQLSNTKNDEEREIKTRER
jgi:hypothetical protein